MNTPADPTDARDAEVVSTSEIADRTLTPTGEKAATLSGRSVVVGVFVFGIVSSVGLFGYWYMHVKPFLAVQRELVARFPDSKPKVDGGQKKKGDENSPKILKVTMQADFLPKSARRAVDERMLGIKEVLRNHPEDVRQYDKLVVRFFAALDDGSVEDRIEELSIEEVLNGTGDASSRAAEPARPAA